MEKIGSLISLLREYAEETGNPVRGTSDLSGLEMWLASKLIDKNNDKATSQ